MISDMEDRLAIRDLVENWAFGGTQGIGSASNRSGMTTAG